MAIRNASLTSKVTAAINVAIVAEILATAQDRKRVEAQLTIGANFSRASVSP